MRRVLCLAIVLVFLALTGLMFLRVSASDAYIARVRFEQIREGMTRADILALMVDRSEPLHKLSPSPEGTLAVDVWTFGKNYCLTVVYTCRSDLHTVKGSYLNQTMEPSILDRLLEGFGFPKSTVFAF